MIGLLSLHQVLSITELCSPYFTQHSYQGKAMLLFYSSYFSYTPNLADFKICQLDSECIIVHLSL